MSNLAEQQQLVSSLALSSEEEGSAEDWQNICIADSCKGIKVEG